MLLLFGLSVIGVYSACKKDFNDIDSPISIIPDSISTKKGSIIIPDGTTYDLSGSSVQMLGFSIPVPADGNIEMVDAKNESTIAWLFDKENNPVMAAFITDSNSTISTATTAKVLLYYAAGLTFGSDTLRAAFIKSVSNNSHVNKWISSFTESWKTDPLVIEKGNFISALETTVKAIIADQSTQQPGGSGSGKKSKITERINTKIPGLFINETGIRSGIEFFEADLGQLSAYNQYRRRAHAFLYKQSYKDNNGISHDILNPIESNSKADKDFALSPASANTSITGELGAMIEGKLEDIAQSKLEPPILLTLLDDETEATYTIHVVGPGVQSKKPVTTDEIAKQTRLEIETFAIDFMFPIIMEVFGWSEDINKAGIKMGSGKTEAFINNVEIFLKAAPDVYEELKNGNYYMATRKSIELLWSGSVDKFIEPLALTGAALVYDAGTKIKKTKVPLDKLIADSDKMTNSLGKAAKILKIINASMLVHDLSRITQAFLNSKQMEEWTVIARAAKVTLLPESSKITAGQELALKAEIKNMQETGGDTHPFFEWSTTGKYGKLKDTKGHSGSSFATADHQVIFVSNASTTLTAGDNIDYVYVKALKGAAVIGYDTVTVNVQQMKHVMKPKGYTVTGKTDASNRIKYDNEVRLYLEHVSGKIDIKPNDTIDYKIVWSTAGTYGKLYGKGSGPSTSLSVINDHEIWYRCTDDKTKKAEEIITAKIYTKKQGTSDDAYKLSEELKGSVTIENDEKKRIIFVPMQLFHGDTSQPWSDGNTLHYCIKQNGVAFDKDKDALKYELKFVDVGVVIGASTYYSWNAGAPSPFSPATITKVPGSSSTQYAVCYTQSSANSYDGSHANGAAGPGGAQITIYLK